MARIESDREDLFREVTALFRRVEFSVAGVNVVAGFRRPTDQYAVGSLSIYYGPDFVLIFNEAGELRRAFHGGLLYRAQPGRKLTRLRRERGAGSSTLLTCNVTAAGLTEFKTLALSALNAVMFAIEIGTEAVRSEPIGEAASILNDIANVLRRIVDVELPIADGI